MVYCKYTVRGACGPLPSLQLLLYALVVRGGLRAVDRRWEQAPIRASVQFHKHSAKPLWISSDTMEKLSNSKTCVYANLFQGSTMDWILRRAMRRAFAPRLFHSTWVGASAKFGPKR